MNVNIPWPQELRVFEVVIFKVGQAVAHVVLATKLGVTPVSVVEDYAGRDLLAVLPIEFEARLPPYGLITRRHRIQSSAMQALIQAVRVQQHG